MDDRNLILGVLAAQAGFVTPAQVMTAASMRMLARDGRSLLDHLVDSSALTPERRDLVMALANEALAANGGSPERVLESVDGARGPLLHPRRAPWRLRGARTCLRGRRGHSRRAGGKVLPARRAGTGRPVHRLARARPLRGTGGGAQGAHPSGKGRLPGKHPRGPSPLPPRGAAHGTARPSRNRCGPRACEAAGRDAVLRPEADPRSDAQGGAGPVPDAEPAARAASAPPRRSPGRGLRARTGGGAPGPQALERDGWPIWRDSGRRLGPGKAAWRARSGGRHVHARVQPGADPGRRGARDALVHESRASAGRSRGHRRAERRVQPRGDALRAGDRQTALRGGRQRPGHRGGAFRTKGTSPGAVSGGATGAGRHRRARTPERPGRALSGRRRLRKRALGLSGGWASRGLCLRNPRADAEAREAKPGAERGHRRVGPDPDRRCGGGSGPAPACPGESRVGADRACPARRGRQ
jgi:hypothetical protein